MKGEKSEIHTTLPSLENSLKKSLIFTTNSILKFKKLQKFTISKTLTISWNIF